MNKSVNKKKSESSLSSDDLFEKKLECYRSKNEKKQKLAKENKKKKETVEQKRDRRLKKKLLKKTFSKETFERTLPESIPYTDSNNPFNDKTLTDVFIWDKKLKSESNVNFSKKQIEKLHRDRIFRNVAEMEELKRNRDARQAAKEDMEMISRDHERMHNSDWCKTEDSFHLNQAKLRSKLRIQEGRAKPIDLLARYISYGNNTDTCLDDFELEEPTNYLRFCSVDDFKDLLADINVYRLLDGNKTNIFWDDITTIIKDELKKCTEQKKKEEFGNIHLAVVNDMLKVFKNKSYDELERLNNQICLKISNVNKGTDIGYWEATLQTLSPYMAKLRLKELHKKKISIRLKNIKNEQIFNRNSFEINSNFINSDLDFSEKNLEQNHLNFETPHFAIPFTINELLQCDDENREQKWQSLNFQQTETVVLQLFTYGNYSPKYSDESHVMPGIDILNDFEDRKQIDELRKKQKQNDYFDSEKYAKMIDVAQHQMSQDETIFTDEVNIEKQSFLWSDKYRPRKPRYFNRIHTGFDWNKYNQTHYDIDNPPPKIVQGYRFNIFYPDLLDFSNTPSFKLTECADPDFAVLRFKCGPPYEDIAFKIVNREWEVNHKHGYKCQFQNGIFQLWFFFKRYRYRR